MGSCTHCSKLELCHLWLDPIIHHEPKESNDDHELGQVSNECGNDPSKQKTKTKTTTKSKTKKKVKRYLHRIVQLVVVVASAAEIITNWIAYSSYAKIGLSPLEGPKKAIQTLWLIQAIFATILTPVAVFVKVIAPLCKREVPHSISGHVVLFDLLINSGGSLLISYNVFRAGSCWIDLAGNTPARHLFWGEVSKLSFKMLLNLVQIIYGFSQGYVLCCIEPCTPTDETTSHIMLKSVHVIALCGVLAFAAVVMATIIDIRDSGSPVLIVVYRNESWRSASVLERFHEADEQHPKPITATYHNSFTGDCFVYSSAFDEEEKNTVYNYNMNYLNSSGNLSCVLHDDIELKRKPGDLFLSKDWVPNEQGHWQKGGEDFIHDSSSKATCIPRKGIFRNEMPVPCSFDTTCKELKEKARRNTS